MKKKTIISVFIVLVIILLAIACFYFFNKRTEDNENDKAPQTLPSSSFQAITEQEKSIFNSNFDMYIGKNVKGMQVKSLIASIKSSNEKTSIRTVDLIINGENSMDSSKIKTSSTYSVSFEYDDKGLICKAIVEENAGD